MPDRRRFAVILPCLLAVCAFAAEPAWVGKPLSDYIDHLAAEGVRIIYSDDLVGSDATVVNEPGGDGAVESLRAVLRPYGLTVSPGPGDYWLIVSDPDAVLTTNIILKDIGTGDGVIGAAILVDGVAAGMSDTKGQFRFHAKAETAHSLEIRADGFIAPDAVEFTPGAGKRSVVRVFLKPVPQALPEIIVSSSVYNFRYKQPGAHTFLDRDFSAELPDVGDEAVRGIDRLPGVASGGVSVRSHVRGGSSNEQLVILDGLRLYEPYHLKDFHAISTIINQSAIDGIDVYTAGYPARYGDRMSGVIDISLRDIPVERETELGLSLFQTSLLSTGRFFGSRRGDWLVSARRSNLHVINRATKSDYGSPKFEDALLHGGWQWSDRTYVGANFLYSRDRIELTQTDATEVAFARYQNNVGWLKIDNDWTPNVSSSTVISATDISNKRTGQTTIPDVVSGTVSDDRDFVSFAVEQDWYFAVSERWSIRGGMDFRLLDADYEYDSMLAIEAPFDQIFDNVPLLVHSLNAIAEGEQYAAYAEARWKIGDAITLDLGLRWDRQTYSAADTNEQRSPRLNILYEIGERTELRAGFGRFYQAQEINELQVDAGMTDFFPPQYADHAVASVLHHFPNNVDLRLEVYQKRYAHLIPRFENVFDPLVLIPELQIDRARIDARKALVEGAEITLSGGNDKSSTQWWAGYAWSSATDTVPGRDVRRAWDQTHAVKAGINKELGRWHISAAATWHSGWPKTELFVETIRNPDGSSTQVATVSPRNSLDFEAFHTLDARASRRFNLRKSELTAFVEVSNLYNRENPCCIKYRVRTAGDGSQALRAKTDSWLPLVPSIGVVWSF